jgi:hypothetical protein
VARPRAEPGRISGALARLLALLAAVAPYPLAARSGGTPHGGLEPVSCRQPQHRHANWGGSSGSGAGCRWLQFGDAGSVHTASPQAGRNPATVAPLEEGHFREVKTGVLLLPSERVETSPGRRSVVRRFLVTGCRLCRGPLGLGPTPRIPGSEAHAPGHAGCAGAVAGSLHPTQEASSPPCSSRFGPTRSYRSPESATRRGLQHGSRT